MGMPNIDFTPLIWPAIVGMIVIILGGIAAVGFVLYCIFYTLGFI